MNKNYINKGFTLIEILVVIVIIGIIAGFAIYTSSDSSKVARDSERRVDISEIRESIQMYASNNYGYYPAQDDDWCCIEATSGDLQCDSLTTLVSNLPTDSLYPQEYETGKPYAYYYKTENEGESFEIYAVLETGGFYYYSSGDVYAREESSVPGGGYGGSGGEWASCGDNITFTYNGSSVTYGTVPIDTGECWMDRNLGATQKATSYNDEDAYGDLFQWGRLDNGHQLRTSSTSSTLLNYDDSSEDDSFIISSSDPYDWRNPQNNNLWQGEDGVNNPCPDGWRIPTLSEWQAEGSTWGEESDYRIRAFNSILKLTSSGVRSPSTGDVLYTTTNGYYWSSSIIETEGDYWSSHISFFDSGWCFYCSLFRGYGFSVRCIKD